MKIQPSTGPVSGSSRSPEQAFPAAGICRLPGRGISSDYMNDQRFSEQVIRMAGEAAVCLERIREGDRASLTEMKQFWAGLKAEGGSNGAPAVTVLGSAFEALSEAWQRARAAGCDHPDAARLVQEALDLLVDLVQQKSPRGGGVLKNLCARATELTDSLSRSAAVSPQV